VAALVLAAALASAAAAEVVHHGTKADPPPARIAADCTPLPAGTHRLVVEAGRVPVVLHVPRGLRPGAPLVLALPGAGQTARDFAEYTGYSRLADAKRFTVAYATATGSRPLWNITDRVPGKPDDVAYLRAVIPAVVHAVCADANRVGVTGVSNGGGMSARMACDAADLVAAAAPVAGGYGALPDCHPSRPIPVLEIHGTSDDVVPYEGKEDQPRGAVRAFLSQWRALDGCAATADRRQAARAVIELRWQRCADGSEVVHDRVEGAGHGWPGEDDLGGSDGFSATRRTWDFLSAFRR
jgi:polyhydroxybutyrate depolymerase